jgi:hypothetical protein
VEHQPRPIAAKLDVAKRDQRLARRGLERRRQRRQLAGRRVVVVVDPLHPGQIDQILFSRDHRQIPHLVRPQRRDEPLKDARGADLAQRFRRAAGERPGQIAPRRRENDPRWLFCPPRK